MKTLFRTAALAAGCLALGACAAHPRSPAPGAHSPGTLEVKTTPPGASVQTSNGQGCGPTPCTIQTPPKGEFTATASKPGYKPANVRVSHGMFGHRPKHVDLALKRDEARQAADRSSPPSAAASDPAPPPPPPPPLAAAEAPAMEAPAPQHYASANTKHARVGRVIEMRLLPDGSILETHSPYD